jgi:hypothetical protein
MKNEDGCLWIISAVFVFLIVLALSVASAHTDTQVLDLQRRVGQLEVEIGRLK